MDKIKHIKADVVRDDGEVRLVVMSDETEDRMGDTIDPNGWKLDNFNKNPVLLWAHDASLDASIPAIGTVQNTHVDAKGRLVGKMNFDMDDPFAQKVAKKYQKGILRAVSVGFKPLKWEQRDDGVDFIEQELLELSAVNVPANPRSVVELRSLGGKHNKAAADLMDEYLKKNAENNGVKPERKQEDEKDPVAERLETVINELKNSTRSIEQIVTQLSKKMDRIEQKYQVGVKKPVSETEAQKAVEALEQLVDFYRLADKAGEIFIKQSKRVNKKTKKG